MKLRSGVEARVWACGCGGCARVGCICLRVQSPLRMHRCVYHAHAGVRACMRGLLSMALARSSPRPPIALRCCARRCRAGAPGRTTRRWMRRRRRCRSSAAAELCTRVAGARGRPARGPGCAGPARRGRTVGAQVRVQHRARGAAGGGRLAEPQETVSAPPPPRSRPRRCADAGSGGS
jgi:hypothetical protein